MLLAQFTAALFSTGQIRVPNPEDQITADDWLAARAIMRERSERVALGYPGPAPAIDWAVGEWALAQFFRTAQAIVYRAIDEDTVRAGLALPCPPAALEPRHYSVDLIFVFLPELVKLARLAAPGDPLIEILQQWSIDWPLSSVGMKLSHPPEHMALQTAPYLWQYYLERIHTRQDKQRQEYPEVREGLILLAGARAQHFLALN